MNTSALRYNLIIVIAAIILFVPFLGAVHLFDWDEINFAECAREMLAWARTELAGAYLIPPFKRYEEVLDIL